MKKRQALLQAAGCLLCTVLTWKYGSSLEGTEFSGGRVTGPILDMKDVGALLFVLAFPLTFFYRRTAAATVLIACLLSLPLYFYFSAPGLFRMLFRGEYSVPLNASFAWDNWAIAGMIALAITGYVT